MNCAAGHRCGSDLALQWLWHRLAETAPTRLLAWEPPYAMGAAPQKKTEKTKKKSKVLIAPFYKIIPAGGKKSEEEKSYRSVL